MWIRYTEQMKNIKSQYYLPILLFVVLFPICSYAQKSTEVLLAEEYFKNGELEKALDVYSELSKNSTHLKVIHDNYFKLLLETNNYKTAKKHIDKMLKKFADEPSYYVDYGILEMQLEKNDIAEKYYKIAIDLSISNDYKTKNTAYYFYRKGLPDYAIKTFVDGRERNNSPTKYALDIAYLYRAMNKKELMLEEYLTYLDYFPEKVDMVKNNLQSALSNKDELESLENVLIEKIQRDQGNEILGELLIWVNLQQKNFYGAFIQAKALDKRFSNDGFKLISIGKIALENQAYDDAITIFKYVTDQHRKKPSYIVAKSYLIKSREELVKNTFPVSIDEIKALIFDYDILIEEGGVNKTTLEAMRNKALLHAFFLNQRDSAINILKSIIEFPRIGNVLWAKTKLDLGDIYLLNGEHWESTLLYSQVEKQMKEDLLGHMAKLKNAKLSYYKGDFELAQAHLDVLKLATSREIANDALSLSLLIRNNTILDTSSYTIAMQQYAAIDLLLFQNKKEEALDKLSNMLIVYPYHDLIDEILWLQAKIYLQKGAFDLALEALNKIVKDFKKDIFGDDAYLMIGKIYEEQLGNKEKAMEVYKTFLIEFKGSIYTDEARKRFRKLRGDILN